MDEKTEKKVRKAPARAKKPTASKVGGGNEGMVLFVGPEQYFFLRDGRPIKSLLELAYALDDINDDVFHHHVNEHKNDFAKWVNDVFQDEALAVRLAHEKTRHGIQVTVLKHLVRRLSK